MSKGISQYEQILFELCQKAKVVSTKVFTNTRPTATEKMSDFVVVRLPQGIDPYADTHDISYVQMICYARDRQGGIENVTMIGEMIDSIRSLLPFNDSLMSCNEKPLVLPVKSDGMGFHYSVVQFRIVIKI